MNFGTLEKWLIKRLVALEDLSLNVKSLRALPTKDLHFFQLHANFRMNIFYLVGSTFLFQVAALKVWIAFLS